MKRCDHNNRILISAMNCPIIHSPLINVGFTHLPFFFFHKMTAGTHESNSLWPSGFNCFRTDEGFSDTVWDSWRNPSKHSYHGLLCHEIIFLNLIQANIFVWQTETFKNESKHEINLSETLQRSVLSVLVNIGYDAMT